MEHRCQLTRRQTLRPGEEAPGKHLESQVLRSVGEVDVPQKCCGVSVIEIVVGLGHRHRGQRRGGPDVEPNQVAHPERRAADRKSQCVQWWGSWQTAERVATPQGVDQRIIIDRGEGGQMGVRAAQQRPQVVVLAEESMKTAIHGHHGAVRESVEPSAHPATQVIARFHDVDTDSPLAEPGGGGHSGDSRTDDDHAGLPRQGVGIRQAGRRRQCRAEPIRLSQHCSETSDRCRRRSHNSSTAVTRAKPNKKSSSGMSNGNRMPIVCRSS